MINCKHCVHSRNSNRGLLCFGAYSLVSFISNEFNATFCENYCDKNSDDDSCYNCELGTVLNVEGMGIIVACARDLDEEDNPFWHDIIQKEEVEEGYCEQFIRKKPLIALVERFNNEEKS